MKNIYNELKRRNMNFKEFLNNQLNEIISPNTPLTRNQVRLALIKFHVNPMTSSSVARRLTQKQLESPKELALFLKGFRLSLEQTMSFIKYLSK